MILLLIISIFLFITFSIYAPASMSHTTVFYVLCYNLFILIAFFSLKEKVLDLKSKLLKHSNLFLVGFVIVFFQYHIDYYLGNLDQSLTFIWVNPEIVMKSLFISSIGMYSFMLGYLLISIKNQKHTFYQKKLEYRKTFFLEFISLGLLVLYFLNANPVYFFNGYGKFPLGAISEYIIVLFNCVIFAILIQKSINQRIDSKDVTTFKRFLLNLGILPIVLAGIYLLSVLLSGDRGPLMVYGIITLALYFYVSKKKLKLRNFLIMLYCGAFIITFLGKVRALDSRLTIKERGNQVLNEKKESRFGSESFLPSTQNLASSIMCLHHAVDYVPSKHDYTFGRFQYQQVTSVIPFSSHVNRLLFSNNHWKYNSSADFITWRHQGEFPWSGDGTSVVSDFYLDFGVFGVILGLFFIGNIFRRSELILYYNNQGYSLFGLTMSIILLSTAVYISRGAFFVNFKMVLWTYFFLIVNKKVLIKHNRNNY